MALPEYKYGKVTGLFPDLTVITESTESPMVCCGYCSAHMACWTAKAGLSSKMQNEAHEMRDKGGRPHNNGSRDSERREGALKAVGVTLKSVDIADIPERLKKGFAVEVALQYADLPGYLKVQKNDFGHSACLFGWLDGKVGYFDPLWNQGARGAWALWDQVRDALWANGNHSTTVVRRVQEVAGAGDFVIYDDQVDSLKTGAIKEDTPFFNDWKMTDQRGKIANPGNRFQIHGYRGDAYAVRVKTGQGYSDGQARPTNVFVAKTKVTDIQNAAPPVTPPPEPDTDCDVKVAAAIKSRDEAWEAALRGGEAWPSR